MANKTVQGKYVVFAIMGIVMAAVIVTVLLSDVREAIHQSIQSEPPVQKNMNRLQRLR